MTDFEKQWIDEASYKELLAKVRFEPVGSMWFVGETGAYLMKVWEAKRKEVGEEAHIKASKELGWGG